MVLEDGRPRLSGQTAVPAVRQARGPSAETGATPVFHRKSGRAMASVGM